MFKVYLINIHVDISNKARGVKFDLSFYLHLCFVYAKARAGMCICADLPEHLRQY